MDIEVGLRELLVLENPGERFTDEVMARVGTARVGLPRDGVVRLADARQRKRGRWILLAIVLVVGAAAATLPWLVRVLAEPHGRAMQAALADRSTTGDSASQVSRQDQSGSFDVGTDPRACIDPDVLQGLLLRLPSESFRLGVPAPPELAGFKAPRQLQWIGGAESGFGRAAQFSMAYRTSLSPAAANLTIATALLGDGWKHGGGDPAYANYVFAPLPFRPPDTYCRDGLPANVATNVLDGATYLVLTVPHGSNSAGASASACDPQAQYSALPPSGMDKYMPKLELPRDPASGQPVRVLDPTSSSPGTLKRSTNVTFKLDDTADNIARHFARQMAAQDWNSETSWSGTGTAGSSWTMQGDGDAVLHATLMVWALDEAQFTVLLQVVTTK